MPKPSSQTTFLLILENIIFFSTRVWNSAAFFCEQKLSIGDPRSANRKPDTNWVARNSVFSKRIGGAGEKAKSKNQNREKDRSALLRSSQDKKLNAGGKPSTKFPPDRLDEKARIQASSSRVRGAKSAARAPVASDHNFCASPVQCDMRHGAGL